MTDLNLEDIQKQPFLPAHLIFMCILYADHMSNAAMLQGILTKSMAGIKQVVMHNTTDLNTLTFWLGNAYQLLCNMKQFGGDSQFKSRDDNLSLSLGKFDLEDYRMVLSDLLVQIYHTLVKSVDHQLHALIAPALLDSDPIPGLSHSVSRASVASPTKVSRSVDDVLDLLQRFLDALHRHQIGLKLIHQLFRQLFYIINANVVNSLLLRKDYCHWSRGMQVRYNLTRLEEWAREHNLEAVTSALTEAMQLSQLLQVCS